MILQVASLSLDYTYPAERPTTVFKGYLQFLKRMIS